MPWLFESQFFLRSQWPIGNVLGESIIKVVNNSIWRRRSPDYETFSFSIRYRYRAQQLNSVFFLIKLFLLQN